MSARPGRQHRLVVPDRRGNRGAVLRPALGQARPQEPVHDHPRRVPDRQRAHRGDAGRRYLAHIPLRHPGPRGHGDRRRVRRDQLGHRRDDPGQVPGPDRPRDQRHLLGGRAHRHGRHALGAEPPVARPGLADRLRRRAGARARHHLRPAQPARVAALADHARQARPRPRRRSRRSRTTSPRPRAISRRSIRARKSRSGRPPRSATSRCFGPCSGSTPHDRSWSRC